MPRGCTGAPAAPRYRWFSDVNAGLSSFINHASAGTLGAEPPETPPQYLTKLTDFLPDKTEFAKAVADSDARTSVVNAIVGATNLRKNKELLLAVTVVIGMADKKEKFLLYPSLLTSAHPSREATFRAGMATNMVFKNSRDPNDTFKRRFKDGVGGKCKCV